MPAGDKGRGGRGRGGRGKGLKSAEVGRPPATCPAAEDGAGGRWCQSHPLFPPAPSLCRNAFLPSPLHLHHLALVPATATCTLAPHPLLSSSCISLQWTQLASPPLLLKITTGKVRGGVKCHQHLLMCGPKTLQVQMTHGDRTTAF